MDIKKKATAKSETQKVNQKYVRRSPFTLFAGSGNNYTLNTPDDCAMGACQSLNWSQLRLSAARCLRTRHLHCMLAQVITTP